MMPLIDESLDFSFYFLNSSLIRWPVRDITIGRKGNPPLLFPFLPIPYPLSPTPFDACYAGYGKCVLKTSALITTLKKLPAQVSLENNRKTFRRLMELFATFLKMQTLKY